MSLCACFISDALSLPEGGMEERDKRLSKILSYDVGWIQTMIIVIEGEPTLFHTSCSCPYVLSQSHGYLIYSSASL